MILVRSFVLHFSCSMILVRSFTLLVLNDFGEEFCFTTSRAQ